MCIRIQAATGLLELEDFDAVLIVKGSLSQRDIQDQTVSMRGSVDLLKVFPIAVT